jgi:ATP-dependent Clp protease ATP-binding subunit ClpC
MYERFTDRARKVMQYANQEAQRGRQEFLDTEHLLLGLIAEGSGVAANVLKNLGADPHKLRAEIGKITRDSRSDVSMGRFSPTPPAKRVIEHAIAEARGLNHDYVGTEHLLLGLIAETDGNAAKALVNIGISLDAVRREVRHFLGISDARPAPAAAPTTPAINKYGCDWTDLALCGKLEPACGRDREVDEIHQILNCRLAPNVLLIAAPGTGGRALIRQFTKSLFHDGSPLPSHRLIGAQLGMLLPGDDSAAAAAGKAFADEFSAQRNPTIMFVDDIEYYLSAQAAAARRLLRWLITPATRSIVIVTPDGRELFEKTEPEFATQFQPLNLLPMPAEATLHVLASWQPLLESHHHVRIAGNAFAAATDRAARLGLTLPGSAVTLLDRACAKVTLVDRRRASPAAEFDRRIAELNRLKENAVAKQVFDDAARFRDQIDTLRKERHEALQAWLATRPTPVVDAAAITGDPGPTADPPSLR